jgi:hypothetical protein
MPHFRKKPVAIEARRLGQGYDEDLAIMEWCGGRVPAVLFPALSDSLFVIDTLEGAMAVSAGDWVIKGVKGEFYACRPDIFEMTYEEVEP